MQEELFSSSNKSKKKKAAKWMKKLVSPNKNKKNKIISEDTEQLCEEKLEPKKKGAKKVAHRVLKQVKKSTWSGLKYMYKGFLYSSTYYPYTASGMPGVDPYIFASASYSAGYRYRRPYR